MKEGWSAKDRENIINYLMNNFGIDTTGLIDVAYIDLIETNQQ